MNKDSIHSSNSGPNQKKSEEVRPPAVGYVHTNGLSAFLEQLNISLVVTTYQAQRVMLFSPNGEKLFMLMRVFERPTGVGFSGSELALVTKSQIWFFEGVAELRSPEGDSLPYQLCYVPHRSFVTGDVLGHEITFLGKQLVFVNTRFSCLATIDEHFSFVPLWKPPFISKIVAEDRCHLNGVVCDDKQIRFATALGETDIAEGWRKNKATGGIIIDVPTGEIISRGLSMPHSPRLYRDKLYVLESGLGELQTVDRESGKRTTVIRLPGYLRGLAFYDRYAFVGLCKIRDKHNFGGLPIDALGDSIKCGLYVIDIQAGTVCGFIEFTKGIEELFDIHILAGITRPHMLGFEEETLQGVFLIPDVSHLERI